MDSNIINISRIVNRITLKQKADCYSVLWVQNKIKGFEIDDILYDDMLNSIVFLDPKYNWKIIKEDDDFASGYVLYLPKQVLDNPMLSKLHINEVRLFSTFEIPIINLAPGIEKRVQAIIEMLDELIGSELNHKDDAIISLLNTFFVYCDGKCNIKSVATDSRSKTSTVYKFKKLVDKRYNDYHEVDEYANLLNISPKYLNECVKEILGTNAKNVITEQLVMKARHNLKFSDSTVKEIGYQLGFSSSDYFSYFFKKHTGVTPSKLRKS